jgi:hypothetical protein
MTGCANLQHPGSSATSFGGKQNGAPTRRVSEAELQDDLLRFESQFNAAIQDAARNLESSSDPNIRYRAALNRLIYSTNSLAIATGPSPEANLLDMVTFIELSRDVLEKYWVPKVFGTGGDELRRAFRQSAANVWGIASKVLGPQQKQVLQQYISSWRKKHPDQINVETVRLSAFSYEAGLAAKEKKEIGWLFSSVQQATEAADAARLFAERALYYTEHAPTLLRLQAKLSTHEIIGELGSSLAEIQSPLGHEREITKLLRELQRTFLTARSTLVDANVAIDSANHLFEQQVNHPDVSRGSVQLLTRLTTLLHEWNKMVTSPRYQNDVSQMVGVAGSLERAGSHFLIRLGEVGAALIVLFWVMALLSRLAFLFLSRFFRNESGKTTPHDQQRDKAA